jgi:hypothetical protein
MYTYIHTYIHTYIQIHIYILYIHTHTHTHTHTCGRKGRGPISANASDATALMIISR